VNVPRVSTHYKGHRGDAYFATQERDAWTKAELARRKFQGYLSATDTVVDFGCGGGYLLALLPVNHKIGVEVNDRNRETAAGLGIETVTFTDELPEGLADAIISNHALEHALHPLMELKGLRRSMRIGGRLVLWLPIDDWRVQRKPRPGNQDHHLYTWTPLLVGNLLEEAGFKLVQSRVVTSGYPGRFTFPLVRRLSGRAFDAVAFASAVVLRRRQLLVVATKT